MDRDVPYLWHSHDSYKPKISLIGQGLDKIFYNLLIYVTRVYHTQILSD